MFPFTKSIASSMVEYVVCRNKVAERKRMLVSVNHWPELVEDRGKLLMSRISENTIVCLLKSVFNRERIVLPSPFEKPNTISKLINLFLKN